MTKRMTRDEQVELVVTLQGFRKKIMDNVMHGEVRLTPLEFKAFMARLDQEIENTKGGADENI